ncbi:uncharacterized protein LOC141899472 [Tubulanus polymorphus]|uniref:uncharacterized protein LOC141899472 n=1 Tax=Tubulanus polymorphus TaxID=672921 RepID=UPI003DA3EEE7
MAGTSLFHIGVFTLVLISLLEPGASQNPNTQDQPPRKATDTIKCFECNVFRGSVKPKQCREGDVVEQDDCVACAKYVTLMTLGYNKPKYGGIHQKQVYNVTTKMCIPKNRYTPQSKDDACYWDAGNSGEQTRCYCFSDLCNAGSVNYISRSVFPALFLTLVSAVLY